MKQLPSYILKMEVNDMVDYKKIEVVRGGSEDNDISNR